MNKLQVTLLFALIVLVSVSMIAQQKIKDKEQSWQLPEESFIDNTVYQIPELIKQPSIVFSKTSSIFGIKIGSTDYDYGFSSGATRSLATWGNGTRAHLTFMERDVTQPSPANRRAQKYVYIVGSTIKTAYPVPKATAASGFGGVDVFNSANLKNVGVMVAHTPCWFAIDSDSGACDFIKTDVPGRTGAADPEITVDNETETLWYIDTGVPSRTQYSVLKSTTFGDSWEIVNTNLMNVVTPTGVFSLGSLDVPILIAPNGNLAVVTTLTGTGSIAPVGTIHPDSAHRIGYFLSTNAGASWAWNTLGRNGDMVIVGNDTIYALFKNFGQLSGVWDSENRLHVVTNGYSVKAINDTDFVTVFSTLYWRTGLTGWKMMSRPEDLYNPRYDTYNFSGNALGFCYPTVSIDPTGDAVFSAWSQMRVLPDGSIDTASNGFCNYDIWYNSSADNGVTWGSTQKLANSDGGLFTYAARHLTAGATGALKRAHIVYLADTAAGCFTFGEGVGPQVDWIYRWIDFNPGAVSVGEPSIILADFTLQQNYPNPFNPTTKIEYTLSRDVMVSLKVYNILGQEVAALVNQKQTPGDYVVNFDASKLSSGVYIYALKAGTFTTSKKMMLMK